jgi:peptidoglycan/LPS O-acetylase OafA/YrhL
LTARVSRIYSVGILAIVITYISDTVGRSYDPNHYLGFGFYNTENGVALFKNLTFVNELWFEHSVYGTNEPYWSLGFEVWYYIFFGLVYFLPGRYKLVAAIAWILVCGPKIALYLPLWLMGVAAYNCTVRGCLYIRKYHAVMFMILTIILYIVVKKLFSQTTLMRAPMFEWYGYESEIVSFVYFMLIGCLVSVNIISFDILIRNRTFFSSSFERWLRWFAGASFTLYLMHMPILILIGTFVPNIKSSMLLGIISIILTLLLILGLAELGERRKRAYACTISWIFGLRVPPS